MLKDKTALISGASRGIGKKITYIFAKNGAFVGINYLSSYKKAKETLKNIKEIGGNGMLLKCDVTVADDVKKMVKKLKRAKALRKIKA